MRLISAITNANPATITTTFDNQYKTGLIVRLDLPPAVGMQQANGLTGTITVISPTTFTVNIDTTNFDVFAIPMSPPPHANTCAQVVPIGEVNEILYLATRNVLPYRS
jgi:hypothetical protein